MAKVKKSRKKRGSRTHGYGAGKKHRGAGHRGGRGNAGVGKRGASKKTKYLAKGKLPFGSRGMGKIKRKEEKIINFSTIYLKLKKWINQGKAKKTKGKYVIDLKKLGYTKLLGSGEPKDNFDLKVDKMSKSAKKKLEAKH